MMKRRKRPSRYQLERQRFRNTQRKILNLEERVQAIRLYDLSPIYMRVATAFNCSWEQIKNVIQNRDAILEYYARCQTVSANDNPRMVRQKKINFLGKVMYEYIRRAHYYRSGVINNDNVRELALMFRNILQIDCFSPNKAWVSDFKKAYNLDFTQLDALVFTQKPPSSLNCLDIVVYCSKELEDTQKIVPRECSSGAGAEESAADVNNVIDVDSKDSQSFEIDYMYQQDEVGDDAFMDFDADDAADAAIDMDPADFAADGDDINENEEGPTIYFGDDDYNAETDESLQSYVKETDSPKEPSSSSKVPKKQQNSQKETLSTNATQLSTKVPEEPALNPQKTAQESQKSAQELQQSSKEPKTIPKDKQKLPNETETTERIPQIKCVSSETVVPVTRKATIIDNALITTLRESLRKDNYAAALEIMRPLEEFALLEENFSAINLLSQLMSTFRNGRKHKIQAHQ